GVQRPGRFGGPADPGPAGLGGEGRHPGATGSSGAVALAPARRPNGCGESFARGGVIQDPLKGVGPFSRRACSPRGVHGEQARRLNGPGTPPQNRSIPSWPFFGPSTSRTEPIGT